ncbi:uncharacterized G-patch domain protein DDB_G0278987-like [Hetaerina americana]|uniref:uncharacterized G-patch domain protein DDB_G0278987-like n=1 Tax=Hetaerina americana TaxID=62018 RepID=UPI003A7F3863
MPSYKKNGGFAEKRGRSRERTPERSLRRRPRDQPPPKRRATMPSTRRSHSKEPRRAMNDRVGIPSTSSGGRTTRNSRGLKRKGTIEPSDDESNHPPRKRQHVEKEIKSPLKTGKSSKTLSKNKSTCAKDCEENEKDNNLKEDERHNDGSDSEKSKEKRKEADQNDENQKEASDKGGKSDPAKDEKEKEEQEENNDEAEVNFENKDNEDKDTTVEGQGGDSDSTENASKTENSQTTSISEDTGKGKERGRTSCMGSCDSREEDEWRCYDQLRLPPKDASQGITAPSGILVGVGLNNWDVLVPLPQHLENDEWMTESMLELYAHPGCVSPPLPIQVGEYDLERLLDLYDIDMAQDYHISITETEHGV